MGSYRQLSPGVELRVVELLRLKILRALGESCSSRIAALLGPAARGASRQIAGKTFASICKHRECVCLAAVGELHCIGSIAITCQESHLVPAARSMQDSRVSFDHNNCCYDQMSYSCYSIH